jgi:hypothetical protein
MAVEFLTYYLGPLGNLRQLPMVPIRSAVDIAYARLGGEHVTLNGQLTLDRVGYKRTWKTAWRCLEAQEAGPLEAAFLGLSRAKLRLLDPRQRNRLTPDGSAGGSYTRSPRAFVASAGAVTFRVAPAPTDLAGVVDGGLDWEVPAGGGKLTADSGTLTRVPLLAGQQVTASVYVSGAGGVQVGATPYDAAGAAQADILAAAVTLGGAWQRLSHTFTPAAGQVAAAPCLVAAAGTARTLQTTGWQLQAGGLSEWVPGTGCPHVVVGGFGRDHPSLAGHDVEIVLREV